MLVVAPRSLRCSQPRRLLLSLGLWLAVGAVSAFAAINSQNYRSVGPSQLSLNGADIGQVYSLQGGDPVGDVVIENSIGGAAPQKHLAGKHYAPLAVEVVIPPSAALADWISDLCAGRPSPKTVVLTETDFNGHVSAVWQYNNAVLSEVTFPDLSAGTTALTAHVTLLIVVSDRQALALNSVPDPGQATTSTANNAKTNSFQLQLSALPPNASKVAAFTLKRGAGGGMTTSSVPSLPNLILTLNLALSTDWTAWATDFVVNGNSGASAEKNGALVFQAADQHPVFTLQLGHVGIVRATPAKISTNAETIPTVEVELYVETASAAVGSGAGTATTDTASSPPSTTPSPTPTSTPPPRLASPTETLASKFAKKETLARASSAANVSAGDVGSSDPKNFPRAPNMQRKSYVSIGQKDMLQEIASYETKEKPGVLDEYYSKQLKASGWTSQSHFESGSSKDEQQILTMWKNGERNAMVTMAQTADSTTVSVSVSTPTSP